MPKPDRGAAISSLGAKLIGGKTPPKVDVSGGADAVLPVEGARPVAPPTHPAGSMSKTIRRDISDIDPARIVERGPYIREWDEDGEEFERLLAAVRARGEIDTPIWVRSTGSPLQRVYVLIAGKGRLKAALRAGLEKVPIRDFGDIADGESILRQVEENDNRHEMTVGERANAYWLMKLHGQTQQQIAERFGKDEGYVSVLVRAGEALATLPPDSQAALKRRGALMVRDCQAIVTLPTVSARAAELEKIRLAGPRDVDERVVPTNSTGGSAVAAERARRAKVAEQPFFGRPIRDGRTFRMKWVAKDVAADPVGLATGFRSAIRQEATALADTIAKLEAEGQGSAERREALGKARRMIEALRQLD